MPQFSCSYASVNEKYGEIVISGLPKSANSLIGSALRKAMLAHLEGAAVTVLRLEGACHELDTVDGVYEDVAEIVRRLCKLNIELSANCSKKRLSLHSNSNRVTAAEIMTGEEVKIFNPELEIARLEADAELQLELEVEKGKVFRKASENRKPNHQLGTIPVPSDFSPVKKVGYDVEMDKDETERLSFQITTNGTISPLNALKNAIELLSDGLDYERISQYSELKGNKAKFRLNLVAVKLIGELIRRKLLESKQVHQVEISGDTISVVTDGQIDPKSALKNACDTWRQQFSGLIATCSQITGEPDKQNNGKPKGTVKQTSLLQSPIRLGDTKFVENIPELLAFQLDSYSDLIENVIPELLDEIFPIEDSEGKNSLELLDYKWANEQRLTHHVPLVLTLCLNKNGKQIVSDLNFLNLPMMTEKGTFIINGEERVVVSQLHRTPGVQFKENLARIIPYHGSWVEFEIEDERVYARLDRRKRIPATCFLRVLGWESDDEILALFENDQFIANTLLIDESTDKTSALIELGKPLGMEDPEPEYVQKRLNLMFLDWTRYDLTRAGRHVMNRKLAMDVPESRCTLEPADVAAVIKKLLENPVTDDLNDLANLRVRCVGELLGNQLRIGMYRMVRVIRERLSLNNLDELSPNDLLKKNGSNPLNSMLSDFFKNSQFSQFLQSTNPLDELTHKRRVIKMGKENSSRSLHPSHFGCLDPFETPEGPNVGMISTLANYAQIDEYGFLSQKAGNLDQQTLGVSASLIPLIEYDEPNRTLMGCNMSRQAVPLLFSEPPFVQTGTEEKIAENARVSVKAKRNGRVIKVDANQIVVKADDGSIEQYPLMKYRRSNMATAINQKPIVTVGQYVHTDQMIAEGHCMSDGMLALGKNLLVAYMPYEGYNYEDGIVISDRLVKEDVFTSIHIKSFRVEIRGTEKLTRNLPSLSIDELENLDERGIVKVGAYVKPNDVLVGKIMPKEPECEDEDELISLIKNEVPLNYKDTSERVPHCIQGQVIRTEYLSLQVASEDATSSEDAISSEDATSTDGVEAVVKVDVAMRREVEPGDKLSNRHGSKGVIAKIIPEEEMPHLPDGTPIDMILNPLGVLPRRNFGQMLETHLGWAAKELSAMIISPPYDGPSNEQIDELFHKAGLPKSGMIGLIDGHTGRSFDMETTVGYQYLMKLHHMVADKIHARSIGPYSILTGQPVGGKTAIGGQRFGEMEVWAMESYGAAKALHEFMTLKSDEDTSLKLYRAIVNMECEEGEQSRKSVLALLQTYLRGMTLVLTIEKDRAKIKIATPEEIRKWSENEVVDLDTFDEMPIDVWSHIELAVPVVNPIIEGEKTGFARFLEVLPVIPRQVRPEIALDAEYTATSDLNELYGQVIEKNTDLRRLIRSSAPEEILDSGKHTLQNAVNALFDNSNCDRPVLDRNGKPLRSLADLLRGKRGLFRLNLLGSRVDYSGRSVIVPAPELQLDECGLPQDIAFKLFEPFVLQKLIQKGHANRISTALKLIRNRHMKALDALSEAMNDRLVLLNRAPTLHRASIQAFNAVLFEDKAIHLHPLVCYALNADFDGDQIAVHLPLLPEVQEEVRERILSDRNVLSPEDGHLLAQPAQDIVLGCYYLTKWQESQETKRQEYSVACCVLRDYELGKIGLHDVVKYRTDGKVIETTVGRVIFNEALDGKLTFVNETVDKKRLFELIEGVYSEHGESEALASDFSRGFLDRIKELGFKYATRSGMSFSLQSLQHGIIPDLVKYNNRTSKAQIRGDAECNYRDGVSAEQHFRLSRVARLGLIDTVMRTAEVGYMMRKLTNALSDLIVTAKDCGADEPRNIVNCKITSGVCAKCYGNDLSTGRPVKLGEPVGMIAASSMSRQALQLSFRGKESGLIRLMGLIEAKACAEERGEDTKIYVDGKAMSLTELLDSRGVEGVHKYLLRALQEIYQKHDIKIHPKHFEVLIRQMISKDKICGIRELALDTDSFLAAASFGNTIQILAKAAIKEQIDPLRGMRESLIAGRLIPAGETKSKRETGKV